MTSPKLLLALMAAAAYAAPQINERQVVGQVLTQLTPAIQQAISSIGIGSSSRSVPSSRFSGTTGFTSSSSGLGSSRSSGLSSSRFSGAGSSRFSGATGGSGSGSRNSGASVSGITSSVVSQLQPSIAAAVAKALAGSRRSSSVSLGSANRTPETPEYENGPAEYNFEYKVADDEQQNYIARQESRDGDTVTGSYNYVNPAGTLVTVNYEAGPDGFKQETSEQKGAVQMRNVPVGWDGPLAGVDDAGVSSGVSASRQTSGLSQSDLIAKILATLQPRITSAVQSAVGQTNTVRVAPRPVAVAPRPVTYAARRPVSSFTRSSGSADQSSIVSSVISSLSPRISSAVSSALAGSNRRSSVSSRGSQASSSGLSGLFGVSGQSTVSLETPEFAIQY